MANTTRAEELVKAMEQDAAFQSAVQSAPTIKAKQAVLEQHGYGDVTLADMKAYVESQGGTIVAQKPSGSEELSEQELEAVAGGLSDIEVVAIAVAPAASAAIASAAAA